MSGRGTRNVFHSRTQMKRNKQLKTVQQCVKREKNRTTPQRDKEVSMAKKPLTIPRKHLVTKRAGPLKVHGWVFFTLGHSMVGRLAGDRLNIWRPFRFSLPEGTFLLEENRAREYAEINKNIVTRDTESHTKI